MSKINKKEYFDTNGYYIERNVFIENEMQELFFLFYDLSINFIDRNKIEIEKKYLDIKNIQYPEHIKFLDHIMLTIFNFNKDLIGEIYDTVSYSSTFMRFLGNKKVEKLTQELMGLTNYSSLYGWTNRIRIDPPADERRTYGWHQEIFYSIPNSKFIQTWCPILRDTTIQNGTIEIKPGSHKEGIPPQTWTEEKGKATQIIIDKNVTDKYKTLKLEMKLGDLLFFNPHLAHKSGHNTTKDEIRFSLVGMWHDTAVHSFRTPKPNFESRSISARDFYNQYFRLN